MVPGYHANSLGLRKLPHRKWGWKKLDEGANHSLASC
jgi:hypothetical protein